MNQFKFNTLKKAYQIYDYINIFNKAKVIVFAIKESSDTQSYKEWKETLFKHEINIKLVNTSVISSVVNKEFASSLIGNQTYMLYSNKLDISSFISILKKKTISIVPISFLIEGNCVTSKEFEQLNNYSTNSKVVNIENTALLSSIELISWLENKKE